MAKFNKSAQAAGTDAQKVRQQNERAAQSPGGYQSEFAADETNAQQVRQQNQQSARQQANQRNASFQSEFAEETNAQQVRQQNQRSQAKKQQNQQ